MPYSLVLLNSSICFLRNAASVSEVLSCQNEIVIGSFTLSISLASEASCVDDSAFILLAELSFVFSEEAHAAKSKADIIPKPMKIPVFLIIYTSYIFYLSPLYPRESRICLLKNRNKISMGNTKTVFAAISTGQSKP